MQNGYCQPDLGQYFTYSVPSPPAGDGFVWEEPDLTSPTWSSSAYILSPTSAGNPFESSFGESNNAYFTDPTLPWALSDDDTLFPAAKNADYPAAAPSLDGNSSVSEAPSYTKSTLEEPESVGKSMEYKPAWTTKAVEKRSSKRVKSSARNSKVSNSKSSRASSSDSESGSNSRGRRNHNLTEKKYRNRLNGQFETLLEALPPAPSGDSPPGIDGQHEKRISKAEVLILAKEHIESLEKKHIELENERKALTKDMEQLKNAWASLGGQMMP
ncbi:hypothetical protein G7Y89_g14784 [Cudoniella acicularis]|uniref:BHLH domain-containing protein n=1 Tax=Cudoniella acicularis TaxID=354080 RepID=A0A8H4VSU7_9HELO|nr:hypothetical protein G7Y89_g14784 [Cudoniella acicularis]